MKLAVFALFPDAECDWETKHWLECLIRSLAESGSISQLALYTNTTLPDGLGVNNLRIEPAGSMRFYWSRWRQHRHWRKQLQAQNIHRVLFFGLQSVFATAYPSCLILQPRDAGRRRLLRQVLKGHAFEKIFIASQAAFSKAALTLGGQPAINVLHGAPPVRTLVAPDTQLVKDRFTDGAAYFLYHSFLNDAASMVLLLKAFSRFKRRQKSGWKLVLILEESTGKSAQLLATYKYRHDVVTVQRPGAEVVQALYAGAYCFVQPGAPGYFGTALLRSLSWGLPLIGTHACREWAGAAALYFEDGSEEQLAEHLMAVYKDEGLQQRLAGAAAAQAIRFSWQPLLEAICKNG